MRIVVFTGNPGLESTPWWPSVLRTPGLEAVLICRRLRPHGVQNALESVRRNVKKHGLIFVPYRLGVLALSVLRRLVARPADRAEANPGVPVEVIEAPDIHAPGVQERVRAWRPDLGLSIGAPILRRSLFGIPARGTINLHGGKVPDYRGMPPGFWELYTGAGEIGATVHWVDDGLDTGSVIRQAVAPIYPTDSLARVVARSEELAAAVLTDALRALARGDAPGTPQPIGGRSFRRPTLRQRLQLAMRLRARNLRWRLGSVRYLARTALTLGWLWLVRPLRDLVRTIRGRHPVRVFTYHRVTDLCRDGMTVPASVLRRQVAYLAKHHRVVSLEEGLRLLADGTRLTRPVAVITFDDGYRSVNEQARPVLEERGLAGCCFVTTDLLGTDRRLAHDEESPVREHLALMSWDAIADLRGAGWSVGGHTATHVRLSACDDGELREELERSLAALRNRLGLQTAAMAYTFGQPDDITADGVRAVRACGYAACFSDFGGENFAGDDLFALKRIELGGDHDALAWRGRVHGLTWRAGSRRRAAAAPEAEEDRGG
ncbi:MAG: polysaccharide deacetylase family protein [Gemmatimonadetes bacterium]|nr:polysaccharide deacetylase family protein [Gemmatimonadota bacterium]